MKTLTEKDLEGVFLIILRAGKGIRQHLPYVRRHFRSVQTLCRANIERQIDIYFSGIFVASKKQNQKKIEMNKEFARHQGEGGFHEVAL